MSLEYYNRDTKDLLYNRPISATTGFLNYLANIGQLNNKGVEFELRTINFASPDFNWTSVLNLTHNRNKIVTLDGDMTQSIEGSWFIHKIGLPYNSFYVKEFAGVDPMTGKALYYLNTQDEQGNYNKEKTDDASKAQAIPYKSADPKISGGFTNIISYKWFDLGLTFTYSLGGYSFDKTGTLIETDGSQEKSYNLPVYALDRWQKPGDITDVPKIMWDQQIRVTDQDLINASYFAIKNITLGYSLSKKWLQKIKMENIRVYATADNIALFTHLKGMDPQYNFTGTVGYTYAPTKTFSLGIDIKF